MELCKFEINEWNCPLEHEDGNDYCYWHQQNIRKTPTQEQFDELKEHKIRGVYLKEARLKELRIQNAYLGFANFEKAHLDYVTLNGAKLFVANFQNASLFNVNFQEADLTTANFQNADLINVNFQGAKLVAANLNEIFTSTVSLVEANLLGTKLRGAKLSSCDLRRANITVAEFDSKTKLDNTILVEANLYQSYIDETKSCRYGIVFNDTNLDEKEIHEYIADYAIGGFCKYSIKSKIIFDVKEIGNEIKESIDLLNILKNEGLVKKAMWVSSTTFRDVIFYTDIINFDLKAKTNDDTINIRKKVDTLLLNRHGEMSFSFLQKVPIFKRLSKYAIISTNNNFLYKLDKCTLLEHSYEVYNKMYNLYSTEGEPFRVKHAHYRRAEVYRKLLLVRNNLFSFDGIKDRLRSWVFDWFILKNLTSYGESFLKPILISLFWIIAFGGLFWRINGVDISGIRDVRILDYFYLSLTTFTGLGFANVQPDISVALMQPLVMAESILGLTMTALIIFVITYQIAR